MKNVDYELVIIGGGPAGLTAGLYAARSGLKVVLLEKLMTGGQIVISDWVENYPGFPEGISGRDLVQRFTDQAKKFGLMIESTEAVSVDLSKPIKKIEILWDSVLTGINGLTNVESIDVENVKSGEKKKLSVDGCFIWVGEIPNTEFLADGVELDEKGFVVADINMETSVPGVFATGDARNTPLRQIATAVGDGAIAAFSAGQYIENLIR